MLSWLALSASAGIIYQLGIFMMSWLDSCARVLCSEEKKKKVSCLCWSAHHLGAYLCLQSIVLRVTMSMK